MTLEEGRELRPGDRIKYIGNNKEVFSIQEKSGGYLTVKETRKVIYRSSFNHDRDYWVYSVEVREGCVLSLSKIELYDQPWSYERDY